MICFGKTKCTGEKGLLRFRYKRFYDCVTFLEVQGKSRGAFCLRMPRRKYFDVSNRWYAPTLRVRKSQNGGDLNKFFDDISLCY